MTRYKSTCNFRMATYRTQLNVKYGIQIKLSFINVVFVIPTFNISVTCKLLKTDTDHRSAHLLYLAYLELQHGRLYYSV